MNNDNHGINQKKNRINNLWYSEKFRISLEAGLIFIVLVIVIVLVFLRSLSSGDNTNESKAKNVWANLIALIDDKAEKYTSSLISLVYTNNEIKVASVYANEEGGEIIGLAIYSISSTEFADMDAYLDWLDDDAFDQSALSSCSEQVSLMTSFDKETVYPFPIGVTSSISRVISYGVNNKKGYATYQYNDEYISSFGLTYDGSSSSWLSDSVTNSYAKDNGNSVMFEIYKIILGQ